MPLLGVGCWTLAVPGNARLAAFHRLLVSRAFRQHRRGWNGRTSRRTLALGEPAPEVRLHLDGGAHGNGGFLFFLAGVVVGSGVGWGGDRLGLSGSFFLPERAGTDETGWGPWRRRAGPEMR